VDGKFKEDRMQDGLKFKGSTNQRIIDVKESLRLNKIIAMDL
jgi:anaerobic ribonucleoside-triphosphate reductase activating protein